MKEKDVISSEIKYTSTKNELKSSASFYTLPSGRKYYKQRKCGKGGVGTVYEFKNDQGERKAVKVEQFEEQDDIEVSQKAAKVHREVNGYCETIIVSNGDGTTTVYTIMDYIDKTLWKVLNEKFETPKDLLQLFKKVIIALRWLNLTCKILHTDVAPWNIMINAKEEVIFIDFMDAEVNSDNSSNLGAIASTKEFMPFIIDRPILPLDIQVGLADLQRMIFTETCEGKSEYPSEIFFDLVIEELDFLIAMIPLAQPDLDEKAFDKIKHQFKKEKILPKATVFAIRCKFNTKIISGLLLDEKLDLVSVFYCGQPFVDVLIASHPEIIEMMLDRLKKENKEEIVLNAFRKNRSLNLDIFKNFKHFFSLEFQKFFSENKDIKDIKLVDEKDAPAIRFLVDNGVKMPCFDEWKKRLWRSFSSHEYKQAHDISTTYLVPLDSNYSKLIIHNIREKIYETNPQYLQAIIKYFPDLYTTALSEFSKNHSRKQPPSLGFSVESAISSTSSISAHSQYSIFQSPAFTVVDSGAEDGISWEYSETPSMSQ